jgi:glycosyltransferase involved in cell wall biosynthesis
LGGIVTTLKKVRPNERIRAFLDSVSWFIRPHNTDWRYVRFSLPVLGAFDHRIEVHVQSSWQTAFSENAKYVKRSVQIRLGVLDAEAHEVYLDRKELGWSRCNLVFSHRGFPVNADPYPVVWQNSILDPEMTAYYLPHISIEREKAVKGPLFARCAVVHVSTQAEVDRLERTFPTLAGRFFGAPFFVPNAKAAPPNILAKHADARDIEILFVGDQARRKGLDVLVEGFRRLSPRIRSRAKLTIVSRQTDGPVTIPEDERIEVFYGLPHGAVLERMRRAHILAVPSRFESYGLVFLEAMSQGTVPVAPNWEVQREILDFGRAGSLVQAGNAEALRETLEHLVDDDIQRSILARNAVERFDANYSPRQVAGRFYEMFQLATARA